MAKAGSMYGLTNETNQPTSLHILPHSKIKTKAFLELSFYQKTLGIGPHLRYLSVRLNESLTRTTSARMRFSEHPVFYDHHIRLPQQSHEALLNRL